MRRSLRQFFLSLAVAFLFGAMHAAQAANLGPSEKLHKGEIYRGRFEEQRMVKKLNQVVRSLGRFVVVPDRGVIWVVERPFPMTVAVTPNGMTQSIVGMPVMRFMPNQMPFLTEATDLLAAGLGGNFKTLETRFHIIQKGTPKDWVITLTPLDQASMRAPFVSITAKGGKRLEEAVAYHADGSTDRFIFSEQKITRGDLGEDEDLLLQTAENIGDQ